MGDDAGIPLIPSPATPAPPAPPVAPTPPTPATIVRDFTALARNLASLLQERRRELVLTAVSRLSGADLDTLERVMIKALSGDKNEKYGGELRRVIRFVRHKPRKLKTPPKFTVSGGHVEKVDDVATGGQVTLMTGVTIPSFGADAYGLIYSGSDADDMRWLQFIWRQMVVKRGSKETPLQMRLEHPSGRYELTVDPKTRPRWNVDSSSQQPFFEEETTAVRKPDLLAMFDRPAAMTETVKKLFAASAPPDSVLSRFHAVTYLVHGMDVLYRAVIDYAWQFTSGSEPDGDPLVSGGPTSDGLDPQHRARMALQFPDLDYLSGPPLRAPLPKEEFEPVLDLAPAGWETKSRLEQYADVATLAKADFIESVHGTKQTDITSGGANKPGLNYQAVLKSGDHPAGEAGYINAETHAYTNPELPVDRFAPLPQTALILSAAAFEQGSPTAKPREKAFALATMRHEMLHAAHYELAIGWLIAWRDELTEKPFPTWLNEQLSKTRMSSLDNKLVFSGLAPFDLHATELLAWIEGFVTALPFLPASPALSFLLAKEAWPAAISELAGAARVHTSGSSESSAAQARIHRALCALSEPQRKTVIAWLQALLDPKSLHPTTRDEERAVILVNDTFPDDFVKLVLEAAQRPCPS